MSWTAIALILLGPIPSLIWLYFYLKKDSNPEPKILLTKVFLMGILIAPIAVILQLILVRILGALGFTSLELTNPGFLFWAALVEEFVKFYAVKVMVLDSPEFDEPTDGMIYLITAALGFATIENILVLFKVIPNGFEAAFYTLALRFFGATLLHALSSALVGYFLALSWFYHQHRIKFIIAGLGFGTGFHYIFNLLLATLGDLRALFATTLLLVGMAVLVYMLFSRVRGHYGKIKNFA